MPRFVINWWPTALTVIIVLYATLWPDPVGDADIMWFPGSDKLVHAIMMGGIASAVLFDHRRAGGVLTRRYIIWVGLIVAVFSVADEYLQGVTNLGRTFDVWDIMANIGGVVIASITAPPVINRIFRSKSR